MTLHGESVTAVGGTITVLQRDTIVHTFDTIYHKNRENVIYCKNAVFVIY